MRIFFLKTTKIFTAIFITSVFCFGTGFFWYQNHLEAKPLIKKLKPGEPLPADIFIKLAKIINPAVVNISTTKLNNIPGFPYFNDPFFDFFLAPHSQPPKAKPIHSLGTGFIIRSNGLILTNTHVINQADTINVQLQDNPTLYKAKVVGKDENTDIAIIKIEIDKPLPTAHLGNSHELQVGEWVAAFGNPYGHGHTMTKGIISAVNREIDELNLFPFLQTDAIINPGNSGGPLVNTRGEVIGVNTAMRTQGISFAIPIDNVKVVLKDLEKYGRVRGGFIGVQMGQSRDKNQLGALIVDIVPSSPAEKAGIKKQDVIISFNGKKIKTYRDLFKAVFSTPVNQTVPMKIIRNKQKINLDITVAERKQISAENEQKAPSPRSKKTAPFNLGLVMVTGTKEVMKSMGMPPLNRNHPIVTEVKPGSPAAFAGFRKKDIILKVNGWQVQSARDVQRRLSKNRTNILNVLRYRFYTRQYVNMIFQLRTR